MHRFLMKLGTAATQSIMTTMLVICFFHSRAEKVYHKYKFPESSRDSKSFSHNKETPQINSSLHHFIIVFC